MRTLLGLSAAALTALLALPSTGYAQSLEERLEQKLKKPFMTNAQWVLDYDEALKAAKDEGKAIFAYFTRSYAP
jgi:hypothetical protein